MIAFGVLCIAMTPVIVADDGLSSVLVFVPFGVMLIALGAVRPAVAGTTTGIEPGTAELPDGRTVRGTLLKPSRRRSLIALVGIACFVLCGIGFLLIGAVALGVMTLVVFGIAGLAGAARLLGGGGALLAPEGIRLQDGHTFVPWDAIDEVIRRQ